MAVISRQGVSKKKIDAVSTCRERGWTRGTVLVDPDGSWRGPRELIEIRRIDVRLKFIGSVGGHSIERIKSFPPNVKEQEDEDG